MQYGTDRQGCAVLNWCTYALDNSARGDGLPAGGTQGKGVRPICTAQPLSILCAGNTHHDVHTALAEEKAMNIVLLLIILLVVFGGGGFYAGGPRVGGSLGGLVLLVLIVLLLTGRL